MRRKLVVLFLTLLMTSAAIVSVLNHRNGTISIASAAEGSSGGGNGQSYQPIINYSYVWKKTCNLSMIVNEPNCSKGRAFGTLGEQKAAENISIWMQEIGLENVDKETINETLKLQEIPAKALCHPIKHIMWFGSLGKLTKVRHVDSHWICFKIHNLSSGNTTLINLTYKENETSDCFPFLAVPQTATEKEEGDDGKTYYIWSAKDLIIAKKWTKIFKNCCVVRFTDWKKPWTWSGPPLWPPTVKAFILVDCFDNTYFMGPSTSEIFPQFLKPGYSINGSVWNSIEENLSKESCEVTVDIYSKWHYENVTSYNVIGELKGRDPRNVVDIVCAHYDCWWNQGAIDEAAETALVLGIAKYMKELEEEKGIKPKHTVKFVAFAGEEYGFRGSIDYIKKHAKSGEETVRYVINPGNFGHNDSQDKNLTKEERDFNICVNKDASYLASIVKNIAKALDYTGWIHSLYGNRSWGIRENWDVSGEDAEAFHFMGYRKGAIQFSRNPFRGYHRDGNKHTEGDVIEAEGPFCGLVNDTFKIESDIVLLTALYLCYEDVIKENLTILNSNPVTFDSGKDGRHDSVRIHFNVSSVIPTGAKIRVDIFNANNTTKWVDGNQTSYFLIGEDGITHGEVVVTPPSTGSPGNYTARLRLYDVNGTLVDEDWTESFFLNLLDVPIANFVYTPENPTDIETITFDAERHSYPSAPENGSNTSRIVNYTWDFGDGSHEYGGIVTHRYADDGYYNVTLTVYDSNGKNASITKQIYVRNVPPEVDFTIEPSQIVTVGETVYFNSTIYEPDGYIVNYTWDFGDGNYSYTRNATHVYAESGFYKVTFTATDDDNDTGTKTKWIWVFDGFVDDDYPRDDPANRRWKSIQNAINDLDNNSMIYVYNGTYNESLMIDKTIKLYGEDNRGAIISNDRIVIDVQSEGSIEIYNFTIRDGDTGIRIVNAKAGNVISNCLMYNRDDIVIDNTSCNEITNCGLHNGNTGVKIVNSEGNIIENCSISGKNNGIYIEDSSYNNIYNCSMKLNSNSIYLYNSDNNIIGQCYIEMKNQFSIFLPSDTGMKIVQSNNNMITLCNISNATSHGIYMASSSGNRISLCNFYDNDYGGVYLVASSENLISSCNFINNSGPGITIDSASSNNTIYYNNFIWNGVERDDIIQAYDAGSGNRWYKATSETLLALSSGGEGNYWSDYIGNDTDNDGVGDTPYDILGPAGSQDRYPLAQICKWDEWFGIIWGSRGDPWVRAPVPYMYID